MLPAGYRVKSMPVLGGLHREYRLEKEASKLPSLFVLIWYLHTL